MTVTLHLFKKGEFSKVYEMPDEIPLLQRVSVPVYSNHLETSNVSDITPRKWVFILTGGADYEFSHIE